MKLIVAFSLSVLLATTTSQFVEAADCPSPPPALGRLHIDFVQWQVLPSRVLGSNNSLPGVKGTPLSYDAQGTRAVSVVFEFPAGWLMEKAHYVNSDQEFLVLSGELQFDDTVYGPGDYAYIPAGFPHKLLRSQPGATVLNFYEGEHLAFYSDAPPGMYQPRKLIRKIAAGPYRGRKLLRRDHDNGEETWLVRVPAATARQLRSRGVSTQQDFVQEMFVLDGDVATPRGIMRAGAYSWHAPNTAIGPQVTTSGYTALLRSKGGPPHGRTERVALPAALDAPYMPCVPDSLRATVMPKAN